MNKYINSDFSVYDLFTGNSLGVDIFSDRRRMLAKWCAMIEKTIIREALTGSQIFVGFQQLEYFLPVFERYQQIAQLGNTIWVFGQDRESFTPPTTENINYIDLHPNDSLIKEWFLLVHHGVYSRSLSAIEISAPNTPHSLREFRGILSSNPKLIQEVHATVKEMLAISS